MSFRLSLVNYNSVDKVGVISAGSIKYMERGFDGAHEIFEEAFRNKWQIMQLRPLHSPINPDRTEQILF
jgi:hypothetical protein